MSTYLLFQNPAIATPTCFGCLFSWSFFPFLLGGLIGYWIWGKYKRRARESASEILRLKKKLTQAEKERVQLQQKLESANDIHYKLKSNLEDVNAQKARLNNKWMQAEADIRLLKKDIEEYKAREVIPPPPLEEVIEEEISEEILLTEEVEEETVIDAPSPIQEEVVDIIENTPIPVVDTTLLVDAQETLTEDIDTAAENIIPQPPIVETKPDIVERQLVKVRRTVNLSGLEDLDGITVREQSQLKDLGYGSMSALAAADEVVLEETFKGTGLNWKYWRQQALYATSGNWAQYYAYQKKKGIIVDDTNVEAISAEEIIDAQQVDDLSIDYNDFFVEDNLQIIEGVGPKIEKILKNAGYSDWQALATTSIEDLKRVLSNAGPRYRIHDPTSWSKQAQLAAASKWGDLVAYQKFINQSTPNSIAYSKVEKLINRHLGFSNAIPTDLKIIEGIGPKIEGLLKAAGINNWGDLSRASIEKLKLILNNAGTRYRLADPTTWPKQAGMAVRKEWIKLKEYQEVLQGGKDVS